MSDFVATVAVVLGTGLGVLSAVGILRMPDVYIRLQVASKASSLGVALLMLGVAAHFDALDVVVRAALVVIFLFLTAPVAAQVIARAAYLTDVPLVEGTEPDGLAGRYDRASGRLASPTSAGPGAADAAPSGALDVSPSGAALHPGPSSGD
jgi:multicomponent Na+:H+ antiporter subunit G